MGVVVCNGVIVSEGVGVLETARVAVLDAAGFVNARFWAEEDGSAADWAHALSPSSKANRMDRGMSFFIDFILLEKEDKSAKR